MISTSYGNEQFSWDYRELGYLGNQVAARCYGTEKTHPRNPYLCRKSQPTTCEFHKSWAGNICCYEMTPNGHAINNTSIQDRFCKNKNLCNAEELTKHDEPKGAYKGKEDPSSELYKRSKRIWDRENSHLNNIEEWAEDHVYIEDEEKEKGLYLVAEKEQFYWETKFDWVGHGFRHIGTPYTVLTTCFGRRQIGSRNHYLCRKSQPTTCQYVEVGNLTYCREVTPDGHIVTPNTRTAYSSTIPNRFCDNPELFCNIEELTKNDFYEDR